MKGKNKDALNHRHIRVMERGSQDGEEEHRKGRGESRCVEVEDHL